MSPIRLRVCWAPRVSVVQSGNVASAASTAARVSTRSSGGTEKHRRVRAAKPVGNGAGPGLIDGAVGQHGPSGFQQSRQSFGACQPRHPQTAAQGLESARGDERPGRIRERSCPRGDEQSGRLGQHHPQPAPILDGVGIDRIGRHHERRRAQQIPEPAQLGGARRRQPAAIRRFRGGALGFEPEQSGGQAGEGAPRRSAEVWMVDGAADANRFGAHQPGRHQGRQLPSRRAARADEGGQGIGGPGQRFSPRELRQPAQGDGGPGTGGVLEEEVDEGAYERRLAAAGQARARPSNGSSESTARVSSSCCRPALSASARAAALASAE